MAIRKPKARYLNSFEGLALDNLNDLGLQHLDSAARVDRPWRPEPYCARLSGSMLKAD